MLGIELLFEFWLLLAVLQKFYTVFQN